MILSFFPIYKERIWGGQGFKSRLSRLDVPEGKIGESWEVSAHGKDCSVVRNGLFKGKMLSELYKEYGEQYFGQCYRRHAEFPLLIKILEATEDLSVQVHPDDEYARINEDDNGKVEAWYIMESEPEAKLVYGVKDSISKEIFRQAAINGQVLEILNQINVQKGDMFYIPAGMVHAVGKGNMIVEVQQSSDVTYRVYDYERRDHNGQKRTLHLEQSLEVIDFELSAVPKEKIRTKELVGMTLHCYIECDYFGMNIIEIENKSSYFLGNDSFEVMVCVEGIVEIYGEQTKEKVMLRKGDSALLTIEEKYIFEGKGKLISSYAK